MRAFVLVVLGYVLGLGIGSVWAEQRSSGEGTVLARAIQPVPAEPPRGLPPTMTEWDLAFVGPPSLSGSAVLESPSAAPIATAPEEATPDMYRIGIDDILDIAVLQPEAMQTTVTVGPDGFISYPFIGSVEVRGRTISQVQEEIQRRLSDGYMKYPVVTVSLHESRSRKFFVYGEVTKPGPYPIEEHTTVLRGISIAGGFTKFGSSSRVKVLRPNPDKPGYQTLKINMKAVMDGNSQEDLSLQAGDIIVVSEGMF